MDDDRPYLVPAFRLKRLPAPELRRDPIVDRWVIVSTDRAGRPSDVADPPAPPDPGPCPFCFGNEHLTPHELHTVPDARSWRVRVVPNRYPAVRADADAFAVAHPGIGAHEVVIECPHHERSFGRLPPDHVADVLRVWRDRMRLGAADERFAYAQMFKNNGAAAGASLEHAHSQIVFLSQVPREVAAELAAAHTYWRATGESLFDRLIAAEAVGPRPILDTAEALAFAAPAGRFPFETWLFPKRPGSHFERTPDDSLAGLASALREVLRRLDAGLNDPPYNVLIHTAPLREPDRPDYRWHIEILPRVTGTAGFEWATGWHINPVPPEQAAAYLRGQ